MKHADQPQTTRNSNGRDAAAQISTTETKGQMILYGLERLMKQRKTGMERNANYQLGWLAAICANIASSDKASRESANSELRELIALGEEAAKK